MLGRYLKAQMTVLLFGGLVGPIFLIVYFALGPFARPYIAWMFWVGLLITAADVLVALWLTAAGTKSAATHQQLTQTGVLVLAQITGISDTSWFVNDQQMIKVNLHFDVPGQAGFDTQETMASSPTRMQILNAHKLVALVDPATQKYEIDWNASALIAGVVPAQFTSDRDGPVAPRRRCPDATGGVLAAECAGIPPPPPIPGAGLSPPKGNTVSNEDIIAGLGEIVEEVAGVSAADVTVEKSFTDDLDIDSLSMVEIAVQAEDKFGVKIPDDELANLKTVGDAVAYIEANQA